MYTLMLVAFMTHMTKPEEVYQLWSEVIVVSNTVTILVTMSDEVVREDQPLVQGMQGHLAQRKLNINFMSLFCNCCTMHITECCTFEILTGFWGMGNDRQQKFGGKKMVFLRICCAGVRLHGLGAVGLAVVHAVLVAGLARLELILRLHPLVHHLHGDPLVLVLGVLLLLLLVDVHTVLGDIRHLDPGGVRQHPQVLQQPRADLVPEDDCFSQICYRKEEEDPY